MLGTIKANTKEAKQEVKDMINRVKGTKQETSDIEELANQINTRRR